MKITLTGRQKILRRHHTRLLRVDRLYWVELVVGNQGFRAGYTHPVFKAEAEWMRDMLAKALSKIDTGPARGQVAGKATRPNRLSRSA